MSAATGLYLEIFMVIIVFDNYMKSHLITDIFKYIYLNLFLDFLHYIGINIIKIPHSYG